MADKRIIGAEKVAAIVTGVLFSNNTKSGACSERHLSTGYASQCPQSRRRITGSQNRVACCADSIAMLIGVHCNRSDVNRTL